MREHADIGFVADAREFVRANRRRAAFRMLRRYLDCSEADLDQVIAKAWCATAPGSQRIVEPAAKRLFGVLAAPFALLRRASSAPPAPRVRWELDTEDASYLEQRFRRVFDGLPGTKRVSVRSGDIPGLSCSPSVFATASPRVWLLLALALPMQVAVWWLLASGHDLLRGYRAALMTFTLYDGHFRAFPSDVFITYADDGNEPVRMLAFRRNGGRALVAVQNSERGSHPAWAFGDVDLYCMFGDWYREALGPLGYRVRRSVSVGSVGLDLRLPQIAAAPPEPRVDVLFVDSGTMLPPDFGGVSAEAGAAEEALLANFVRFEREHPELACAYQPRNYGPEKMAATVALLRSHAGDAATVLPNTGSGESYVACAHSKVTVTFQSTLGWEAFLLGAKNLFVNYSPYPAETLCEDPAYQLVGKPDFDQFEAAVLRLLGEAGSEPPAVALEHICAADGHTQERVLEAVLALPLESGEATRTAGEV